MTRIRSTPPSHPVALYVHVPFCRSRCAYCDFDTYTGLEFAMPAYTDAVCREIEAAGERWGSPPVSTIYFGGGTPSLLPLPLLRDILHAAQAAFRLSPAAEISLEANPGTLTSAYLHDLRNLGVQRLSLGIQSFHDAELELLGRLHTQAQARAAVAAARESGFRNLNLDLIYGLPRQKLCHWQETLRTATALEPEHLSLYGLAIEEETPLARQIAAGALPAPDPDRAADMYEWAAETLAQAGYRHYEISNWARSGQECRHNLTYWRNEPWLGVGAGAHSWLDHCRWANLTDPLAYIQATAEGRTPIIETTPVGPEQEMGDTMMLGLRLAEGVATDRFRARFGLALETVYGETLRHLQDLDLLTWDGQAARLTPRGRLLGNQVFVHFV
ncbi:MAG TPA: radical SAM family heme chaperone HemW [Chloroflexi bacterium]|nr:radical SAM family heme chaperone HemW [Chloroflexota bacterium]